MIRIINYEYLVSNNHARLTLNSEIPFILFIWKRTKFTTNHTTNTISVISYRFTIIILEYVTHIYYHNFHILLFYVV